MINLLLILQHAQLSVKENEKTFAFVRPDYVCFFPQKHGSVLS